MYCFVDDSKHAKSEFICLAYVFSSDNMVEIINETFNKYKVSENYEYKSSSIKSKETNDKNIREDLIDVIRNNCQISLAFFPYSNDGLSKAEVKEATISILDANNFNDVNFYYDESIIYNDFGYERIKSMNVKSNSITEKGIQLADIIAHIASVMLKCETGELKKIVPCDDPVYSGSVELEFELWAKIRYSFLIKDNKYTIDDVNDFDVMRSATFETAPNGLWFSKNLKASIIEAIENRFGSMYLGCIH